MFRLYHTKYMLDKVIRQTDIIAAPKIGPDSQVFLKQRIYR